MTSKRAAPSRTAVCAPGGVACAVAGPARAAVRARLAVAMRARRGPSGIRLLPATVDPVPAARRFKGSLPDYPRLSTRGSRHCSPADHRRLCLSELEAVRDALELAGGL